MHCERIYQIRNSKHYNFWNIYSFKYYKHTHTHTHPTHPLWHKSGEKTVCFIEVSILYLPLSTNGNVYDIMDQIKNDKC